MIKYICPVCDQIMQSSHYCATCRSVVKKPWVRDVTYYLNERHPEKESNCSYHSPELPETGGDTIWDRITTMQNAGKVRNDRKAQSQTQKASQLNKQARPNKQLSPLQLGAVILFIYVIFRGLAVFLSLLSFF